MKKTSLIYVALSVLLAAVSCGKEPVAGVTEGLEDGILLNFVCGPQTTKTTMDGDDDYNENVLTTIDYFLYKQGATNADALIHGRVEMNDRTSYNVMVNNSQLTTLFSGAAAGAKCDVYIIANYPTEITSASTDTTTLRALAVSTAFKNATVQDDFIMAGAGQATVINKNKTKAAEGTITLNRAASKVTFECAITSSVDITNRIISGTDTTYHTVTWIPLLDNANFGVYLVNASSAGTVGGDPATFDEANIFRYAQRKLSDDDSDGWYSCEPFYTYPRTWSSGDEYEPFLKLVVPWAFLDSSGNLAGQKQFYYKIPCPGLRMDANTWYHVKLDVAILGGDDFEATVTVDNAYYYVVSWNTQTIVEADAEIKDARYISAPKQAYNMYNTNEMSAVITSSHDAEMNLKSVYYYDFKTASNIDYTSTALSNGWISYDDDTRTFSINHTLNNDITDSDFDASPYVFTFEIHHSDEDLYTTGDIVITQYPAMYIESELSNGKVFVDGTGHSGNSSSVSVYDDRGSGRKEYSIGSISNPSTIDGSGDNNNQNQYTVHVTTLPLDSEFVIGDPRIGSTTAVGNLSSLGSDYQPAADDTQNVIAPVFKIASSYGKTSALWYDNAKERCAAYQENGYPAGRWRLPTLAEIEFLVTLSNFNKIPSLFTTSRSTSLSSPYISYYWAGGEYGYGPYEAIDFSDKTQTSSFNNLSYEFSYTYNGTTTEYHSVYTRCVYDVWYWGDDQDTDHLTSWGGYQTSAD